MYERETASLCVLIIDFHFSFRKLIMATEGDPTDFMKVLHLLVISFTWGMQVWVSFIAGTLIYTCSKLLSINYAVIKHAT